jgi:hypothetical protein
MPLNCLRHTACACALAAASLCLPAQAAPIVAIGSSYDMVLFGENLPPVDVTGIRFDGLAQTIVVTLGAFTRTLNIVEADTDLGGVQHHIVLDLTSDGDLFPGRSTLAGAGGVDPFDLLSPVRMNRAVITIGDADGTVRSGGFAVYEPEPWDGHAPRQSLWGGSLRRYPAAGRHAQRALGPLRKRDPRADQLGAGGRCLGSAGLAPPRT